jgi:hypothetical protein
VKDENNGIRDYSPYGLTPYAAYTELVNNPYAHHHHSMLAGHHPAGKKLSFFFHLKFTYESQYKKPPNESQAINNN